MKIVLITGIDKGIGKALAEKFLEQGYFVIGTVFEDTDLSNDNLITYNLDLASGESISNCVEGINKSGKKIDILINNAGVLLDKEETSVVIDKLRKTLEINLIGTIDFTEQILSLINKEGHIINISSAASSLGRPYADSRCPANYPSYRISKTALNMYTKTLAFRLNGEIIISSINPGWVKTDMGGQEAELTSKESAKNIFDFAISKPETGQFWSDGKKYIW
ncbi:MAG: SDR family NAD(P)-dependent oxidoreductase [Candidatus Pacebacteria bacterium]|nr:SDR family NAD(P)-dependent oxidoreductase [Candidatus Paceibacterota bacterium]